MDRTRPTHPAPGVHPAVVAALDRAVVAGIVDRTTADAIAVVAPTTSPAGHGPRVSPVIEALTYVGACLVMVGVCVFVSQYWEDLPVWSRPALLALAGAGLAAVGGVFGDATPVTWRLRNVTWVLALGALAGSLGVATVDALGWTGAPVATAIGTGVAVAGLALWRLGDLPLVQAGTFVGLAVATGGVLAAIDGAAAVGLGVLALGAVWTTLGYRGTLPPPYAAVPIGMLAMIVGPQITMSSWHTAAPVIGLCVATSLVVAGTLLHTFVVTAGGVLGLFLYLPLTVARVFGDTGGPAAVLLTSGALLLMVVTAIVRRGPHGSAGTPV